MAEHDNIFQQEVNPDTGAAYQTQGEKVAAKRKARIAAEQEQDAATRDFFIQSGQSTPVSYEGVTREEFVPYGTDVVKGVDYENKRAKNQSVGEEWLNATGKMGTLAGTTFADGILGTLWGAGEMLVRGDASKFWDNAFSRKMAEVSDKVEHALPNYLTYEQQNTPWYLRAATGDADFWGDTMFKNLGFAIGAMASGAVWGGGALKASGAKKIAKDFTKRIAKKLASSTDETLVALSKKSPDDIAKALANEEIGMDVLEDVLRKEAGMLTRRNLTAEVTGSVMAALGEARIEAIHAGSEYADKLIAEGYSAEEARKRAKAVSNTTFVGNAMLLSVGNFFQFAKVFGGGFTPKSSTYGKLNRFFNSKVNRRGGKYVAKDYGKTGKALRALKNPLWEASEEMNQSVIKKASENYYTREFDPNATAEINSFWGSMLDAASEVYGSEDGWEEGFAGFFTGALGIPNIVRLASEGKFSMEGGIRDTYQELTAKEKESQQLAEMLNNIATPETKKNLDLAVANTSYENSLRTFLENNDPYQYKNTETSQTITNVLAFAKAGRLQDYMEILDNYGEFSGAEIKKALIIKEDAEGNPLAEDDWIDPNEELSDEDLENNLKDRIKGIKDIIKETVKNRRAVEVKFGGQLDAKALDYITHDLTSAVDTEYRISQLSGEINNILEENIPYDVTSPKAERYGQALGILNALDSENIDGVPKTLRTHLADEEKVLKEMSYLKTVVNQLPEGVDRDELKLKIGDLTKLINRRRGLLNTYSRATENPQKFADIMWDDIKEIENAVLEAEKKKASKDKSKTYNKLLLGEDGSPMSATETLVDKDTGEKKTVTHGGVVKAIDKDGNVLRDENGKELEFEVRGKTNTNGILLVDEEGNKAYYNPDDTFSYEKQGLHKTDNIADFEIAYNAVENIRNKRLKAKLKALENFGKRINSNIEYKTQEAEELKAETDALRNKLEDLKKEQNLRESKSMPIIDLVEEIRDLEASIIENENIYKTLIGNIEKLQEDIELLKREYTRTREDKDRFISKYYQNEDYLNRVIELYDEFELTTGEDLTKLEELIIETELAIEDTDFQLGKLRDYSAVLKDVLGEKLDDAVTKKKLKNLEFFLETLLGVKGLDVVGEDYVRARRDFLAAILTSKNKKWTAKDLEDLGDLLNMKTVTDMIAADPELQERLEDVKATLDELDFLYEEIKLNDAEITRIIKNRNSLLETLNRYNEMDRAVSVVKYYKQLKDQAHNEYAKIVNAFNTSSVPKSDTKTTVDEDIVEATYLEELENNKKVTDPAPVFADTVEIFYRPTAGKEDVIAARVAKDDYKDAPELKLGDLNALAWFDFSRSVKDTNKYKIQVYSQETVPEELKDRLFFIDENHLLAVPIDAVSREVVEHEGYIPAASMPDTKWKTKNGKGNYRFANMEDVSDEVKDRLMDEWKEARQKMLSKIHEFPIIWKTPGAINSLEIDFSKPYIPQLNDPKGTIFKYTDDIKRVNIFNASDKGVENVEGRNVSVRPGYTYAVVNDTPVLLYQKKLKDTKENERAFRLFEFILNNPKDEDASTLVKHLKTFLYIREQKGKPFQLNIGKSNNIIYYGNKVFKPADLKNEDKVREFKEFLGNKYHNVNTVELQSTADYTHYDIKDGAVVSKDYTSDEGGYKNYILEDDNSPKIKVNLRSMDEPQFWNTSLQLTPHESIVNSAFYTEEEVEEEDEVEDDEDTTEDTEQPDVSTFRDDDGNYDVDAMLDILDKAGAISDLTDDTQDEVEEEEEEESVEDEIRKTIYGMGLATSTEYADDLVEEFEERLEEGEKADAILKDIQKKISGKKDSTGGIVWDRRAQVADNVEKLIRRTEINWFEKKFDFVKIKERVGLIDNKSLARLKSATELLLSDEATEGTLYHEAFHVVSEYILSKEERDALYEEVRQQKGTVLTYKGERKKFSELEKDEIEEVLAEEFRDYMLVGPENYKFGKANKAKRTFFQRILDFIKDFFNNSRTQKVFERIATTERFDLNDDTADATPYDRIANFSEARSIAMIQDFNVRFFKETLLPAGEDAMNVDISKLNRNVITFVADREKAFNSYVTSLATLREKVKDKKQRKIQREFYTDILKNKEAILRANDRYLRQFGINQDFFNESRVEESEKENTDSTAHRESNLTSVKEHIPNIIKFILAGIPVTETRIMEGRAVPFITKSKEYNSFMLENYAKLINTLTNALAGKPNYESMVEEIEKLIAADQKGRFKYDLLLNILQSSSKTPTRKNISKDRFDLHTVFYNHFAKNKNNPLITIITGDDVYITDAVGESVKRGLVAKWKTKIKDTAQEGTNSVFSVDSDGNITASVKELRELKGNAFLDALGIEQVENLYRSSAAQNAKDYVKRQLSKYKGDRISVDEIFDREGLESSGDFKKLAEAVAMYSGDTVELVWINPENKREYSIVLNSHISNTVSELKKGILPDHLNPEYNPNTKNSKWLEHPDKLDLVLLRGAKPEFDTGIDTSKLAPADFIAMEVNAVLMGYSPYLRSADRKLEYAFVNPAHKKDANKGSFVNTMLGYLQDTMEVTSMIGVNSEHKFKNFNNTKRTTAQKFGIFESVLNEDLMEYMYNELVAGEYAGSIVQKYEKQIKRDLERFYKLGSEDIIAKLREENVLTNSKLLGVSEKALNDNGLSKKELDINKLGETIFYNYTIGAIEQTKLITGDPRHFKSAEDFHKRTTGAASTKGNSMWGPHFYNPADRFYKRIDGKTGATRDIITTAVFNDQIVSSPNYGKIEEFEQFTKANEADAQSLATLDEYRDLMLRNGKWNNDLQETWDYQQKTFLEYLMETRPEEAEYWRAVYNELNLRDKEFDIANLTPLPPLKPQGFGNLYSRDGKVISSFVTDFTKTSTSPLLPTEIIGTPLFDKVLDMIDNGVGLLIFDSGKKGDSLVESFDKDGKPIIQDFYGDKINTDLLQGLHYKDFGIQLEIDPSGKSRVTRAAQMERLFMVNFPGNLSELQQKHTATRNALYDIAEEKVLLELGLEDKGDNKYSVTDPTQFKNTLSREFDKRLMQENVYIGLTSLAENLEEGSTLDNLISKDAIEAIFNSMIRKALINFKSNGDMLVQESVTGKERTKRENVTIASSHLKFYDGKNPMEVEVALPKKWVKWVETTFEGNNFREKLADFNGALANSKNDDRFPDGFESITEFPLNRTPTDDIHNIEYARVKRFMDPTVGSKIIIPTELVIKSGSDFDIDKLTAYFNNFRLENNRPVYVEYISEEMLKENPNLEKELFNRVKNELIGKKKGLVEKKKEIQEKYKAQREKKKKGKKISRGIRDSRVDVITDSYINNLEKHGYSSPSFNDMIYTDERAEFAYDTIFEYGSNLEILSDLITNYVSAPNNENKSLLIESADALGIELPGFSINELEIEAVVLEGRGKAIMDLTKEYHNNVRFASTAFNTYRDELDTFYKENKEAQAEELENKVYSKVRNDFNNFSLERKNGKQALENRLNSLIKEALLHPDNYHNLLKPTEAPTLDPSKAREGGFAKKYSKSASVSFTELITFRKNIDVSKNNWAGMAGVGLTAVQITSHAATQYNNVHFRDKAFRIWLPGNDKIQTYKLGFVKDKAGNTISHSFGEFLTAFVDIAKDPYIADLNAGTQAFNIWSLLLRAGGIDSKGNEIAPASLEQVGRFMNQPIIKEFVKERIRQESLVNKLHGKYESKEQTIAKLVKNYGTTAQIKAFNEKGLNYVKYEERLDNYDHTKETWDSDLFAGKTVTMLDLTKETKAKQVDILDQFLVYQQYAKELSKLNQATRPEASFPNNRAGVQEEVISNEELIDNGIFETEDINNLLNSSYIGKVSKVRKKALGMYGDMFLVNSPAFKDTFTAVFNEILGPHRTRKAGTSLKDRAEIAKRVEQDLLTFILHNSPTENGESIANNYEKYIFTGANSVAKRLIKMQKKYPNNGLLNYMQPVINEYIASEKKNTGLDNVKLFANTSNVEELNSLTTGFAELFEQEPEFARELAELTVIQSGYSNTFMDYRKVVPEQYWYPIAKQLIDNYLQTANLQDDMMKFIDMFHQNNFYDSDIVPIARGKEGTPISQTAPALKGFNYIKTYDKRTKQYTLFKRVGGNEFNIIPTKGKKVRFKDFNMDTNVLDFNEVAVESPKTLSMQKDNVQKILSGEKTTTLRTSNLPSGIYNIGGKLFNLTNKGLLSVKEAGGVAAITKSEAFAKSGPKFNTTKEFLAGKRKLYVIDITPTTSTDMASIKEFPQLSDLPVTDELIQNTKNFLNRIGVEFEEVDSIMSEQGVNAAGVAKLTEMLVQVEKSAEGLASLPEEAAHFFTVMLPKDNALRKKMLNAITKYQVYEDVKKTYGKIYNNDENLIRLEAAGKLIAEQMKAISAGKEYKAEYSSFIKRILDNIAKWWDRFRGKLEKDAYIKAAYDIMEGNVDQLITDRAPSDVKKMYNLYESRAKQAGYAFADEYTARKKEMERVKEQERKEQKEQELLREISYATNSDVPTIESGRRRLLRDFDRYFPGETALNQEEREMFVENLADSEVEMYCY